MSVSIEHYCGNNAHQVMVGDKTVWFSYQTPVAFQSGSGPIVVIVNCWGNTTGKHLNEIDGGDREARNRRLSRTEFVNRFESFCEDFRRLGK